MIGNGRPSAHKARPFSIVVSHILSARNIWSHQRLTHPFVAQSSSAAPPRPPSPAASATARPRPTPAHQQGPPTASAARRPAAPNEQISSSSSFMTPTCRTRLWPCIAGTGSARSRFPFDACSSFTRTAPSPGTSSTSFTISPPWFDSATTSPAQCASAAAATRFAHAAGRGPRGLRNRRAVG